MKSSSEEASRIIPQKNEFDDHFLDVVGRNFTFDHAKGMAEWIKNSTDAYSREDDIPDAEQFIILRFTIGVPKKNSIFECIDFVGMSSERIENAFKIWGLETAAKGGKANASVFGGHGNGGKFYMRQMFHTSQFITFRGGLLNTYGFNSEKAYGFAEKGKNVKMALKQALKVAGIDHLEIPVAVEKRWEGDSKNAGFTVVRGYRPEKFSGKSTVQSLVQKISIHPQARRILARKPVMVLQGRDRIGIQVQPPSVAPKPGFEAPREYQLPSTIIYDGQEVQIGSKKHPPGVLTLRTSADPMTRSAQLAELNTIEIIGELSCIGTYRMNELGVINPQSEFIYGECGAAFLEDEELGAVTNDRDKLVKGEVTDALLSWIRVKVGELAAEIAAAEQATRQKRNLQESSVFNRILDRWKNAFMARLRTELFGGADVGVASGGSGGGSADGTGGSGGGGGFPIIEQGEKRNTDNQNYNGDVSPGAGVGEGAEGYGAGGDGAEGDAGKGPKGEGSGSSGGSGQRKQAGSKFPTVLLSSQDPDPLSETGEPLHLSERQPPVYQRDQDLVRGIYWINTARPIAEKIMKQEGTSSTRWRDYLFQRYVEIIIKQQLIEMGKHDPNITIDKVDALIDGITVRVHDAAAKELDEFLFSTNMNAMGADATVGDAGVVNEEAAAVTTSANEKIQPMTMGEMIATGNV